MCQTHSKQTKFTEDLGSKNINAQTQLLIARRLYHRGAQTDQKEEATWKLKEQHRIEKSQCTSQNSSNPLLQTEPSSARNPRGGQSGADELIPGWTAAPCGTGNRWWPGCSSALPPQKWKRFLPVLHDPVEHTFAKAAAGTSPGIMWPLWLLIFKGETERGRDLKKAARFMRKLKSLL